MAVRPRRREAAAKNQKRLKRQLEQLEKEVDRPRTEHVDTYNMQSFEYTRFPKSN